MPIPFTANLNLRVACRNGWLKDALHILLTANNTLINSYTNLLLLQICINKNGLLQGKQIHSLIDHRRFAFSANTFVQNKLINMYVNCGSLVDARKVFDDMKERDSFSWNFIIAAYRRHGYPDEAFTLFHQMQRTGVEPNQFTFASVLPACAKLRNLAQGMNIHQSIIERGFLSDIVVENALLGMYAKCGSIRKARELFDIMPEKNVVSWNTMIAGYAQCGARDEALRLVKEMPHPDVISWSAVVAGYAQNGLFEYALEVFKEMQLEGLKPNPTTFASILSACGKMGDLKLGMDIHQRIIECGFSADVVVASALIDMYAKCGSIGKARELFDKMLLRDVVLWTAMVAGYAQNGFDEKALETFKQMQLAGIKPNPTSFASILPACAKMGALEQGTGIHESIIESGFHSNVIVASALVDMYAKCGSIHKARELFDKMPHRNVISWNALIAGYAQNGFCYDALKIFELIKLSGTNPDDVTFTCVLLACTYAGLVEEGCKYFNGMCESHCIMPTIDHYVCMTDLLGRAGYLEETLNFIIKMPIKPEMVVWTCLLDACRPHNNIRLGAFTANLLFELYPDNAATYVLMSNMYSEVGRWSDAQMVRRLMEGRGIKKIPGCSWIEDQKIIHVFCAGDRSHPQAQEIYEKLENLSWEMKVAGYFPDSTHVMNDVEEEEKELFVCHHSEKLAIAFGLLNTPPRTTIRIVKNLRVCVECHTATKFISNIVAREIVVRDVNRFHHFKQGKCSCGDYW